MKKNTGKIMAGAVVALSATNSITQAVPNITHKDIVLDAQAQELYGVNNITITPSLQESTVSVDGNVTGINKVTSVINTSGTVTYSIPYSITSTNGKEFNIPNITVSTEPTLQYTDGTDKSDSDRMQKAITYQAPSLTGLNSTSSGVIKVSYKLPQTGVGMEFNPHIVLHCGDKTIPLSLPNINTTAHYNTGIYVNPTISGDSLDINVSTDSITPWSAKHNPYGKPMSSITFSLTQNDAVGKAEFTPISNPDLIVNSNGTYTLTGSLLQQAEHGKVKLFNISSGTTGTIATIHANTNTATWDDIPTNNPYNTTWNHSGSASYIHAPVGGLGASVIRMKQTNSSTWSTFQNTTITTADQITFGATIDSGIQGNWNGTTFNYVQGGNIAITRDGNATYTNNLNFVHLDAQGLDIMDSGTPEQKYQLLHDIYKANNPNCDTPIDFAYGTIYPSTSIANASLGLTAGQSSPLEINTNTPMRPGHIYVVKNCQLAFTNPYTINSNSSTTTSSQVEALPDTPNGTVVAKTFTLGTNIGGTVNSGNFPHSNSIDYYNSNSTGFMLGASNEYTPKYADGHTAFFNGGNGQSISFRTGEVSYNTSALQQGSWGGNYPNIDGSTSSTESTDWIEKPHDINVYIKRESLAGGGQIDPKANVVMDLGSTGTISGPIVVAGNTIPKSGYTVKEVTINGVKQTQVIIKGSAIAASSWTTIATNNMSVTVPFQYSPNTASMTSIVVSGHLQGTKENPNGNLYQANGIMVPGKEVMGNISIPLNTATVHLVPTINNNCLHSTTAVDANNNATISDMVHNSSTFTKQYIVIGELPESGNTLPSNSGEPSVGGLNSTGNNLNESGCPMYVLPKSAMNNVDPSGVSNAQLMQGTNSFNLTGAKSWIENPASGWIKYTPGMSLSGMIGYTFMPTIKANDNWTGSYSVHLTDVQSGAFQYVTSQFKYFDVNDGVGSSSNIIVLAPNGVNLQSEWTSDVVMKTADGSIRALTPAELAKKITFNNGGTPQTETLGYLISHGADNDGNFDLTPDTPTDDLQQGVNLATDSEALAKLGYKLVGLTVQVGDSPKVQEGENFFNNVGIMTNTGLTKIVYTLEPLVAKYQDTVSVTVNGKEVPDTDAGYVAPQTGNKGETGTSTGITTPVAPKGYVIDGVTVYTTEVGGKIVETTEPATFKVPTKIGKNNVHYVYNLIPAVKDTVKVLCNGKELAGVPVQTGEPGEPNTGNSGVSTPIIPKGYEITSITVNGKTVPVGGYKVPDKLGKGDTNIVYNVAKIVKDTVTVKTESGEVISTQDGKSGIAGDSSDIKNPKIPNGYHIVKITSTPLGKEVVEDNDTYTVPTKLGKEDNNIVYTIAPNKSTLDVTVNVVGSKTPLEKTTATITDGYFGETVGDKGNYDVSIKGYKIVSVTFDGKTISLKDYKELVSKETLLSGANHVVYNVEKIITNKVDYTISTQDGKTLVPITSVAKDVKVGEEVTTKTIIVPKGYEIVSVTGDTGKINTVENKDKTEVTITTPTSTNPDKEVDTHLHITVKKIPTGDVTVEVIGTNGHIFTKAHQVCDGEVGQAVTNYLPTIPAGYHLVKTTIQVPNGKEATTTESDISKDTIKEGTTKVVYTIAPDISKVTIIVKTNTGKQIGKTQVVTGNVGSEIGSPLSHVNIPKDDKITGVTYNGNTTSISKVSKETYISGHNPVIVITVTPPTTITPYYKIGDKIPVEIKPTPNNTVTPNGATVSIPSGMEKHYNITGVTINGKHYNNVKVVGNIVHVTGAIPASPTDHDNITVDLSPKDHVTYTIETPDGKKVFSNNVTIKNPKTDDGSYSPDTKVEGSIVIPKGYKVVSTTSNVGTPVVATKDGKTTLTTSTSSNPNEEVNTHVTIKVVPIQGQVIVQVKDLDGKTYDVKEHVVDTDDINSPIKNYGITVPKGYHIVSTTLDNKPTTQAELGKDVVKEATQHIVYTIAKDVKDTTDITYETPNGVKVGTTQSVGIPVLPGTKVEVPVNVPNGYHLVNTPVTNNGKDINGVIPENGKTFSITTIGTATKSVDNHIVVKIEKNVTNKVTYTIVTPNGKGVKTLVPTTSVKDGVTPGTEVTSQGIEIPKGYHLVTENPITGTTGKVTYKVENGKIVITTPTSSNVSKEVNTHLTIEVVPNTGSLTVQVKDLDGKTYDVAQHTVDTSDVNKPLKNYGITVPKGYHIVSTTIDGQPTTQEGLAKDTITEATKHIVYTIAKDAKDIVNITYQTPEGKIIVPTKQVGVYNPNTKVSEGITIPTGYKLAPKNPITVNGKTTPETDGNVNLTTGGTINKGINSHIVVNLVPITGNLTVAVNYADGKVFTKQHQVQSADENKPFENYGAGKLPAGYHISKVTLNGKELPLTTYMNDLANGEINDSTQHIVYTITEDVKDVTTITYETPKGEKVGGTTPVGNPVLPGTKVEVPVNVPKGYHLVDTPVTNNGKELTDVKPHNGKTFSITTTGTDTTPVNNNIVVTVAKDIFNKVTYTIVTPNGKTMETLVQPTLVKSNVTPGAEVSTGYLNIPKGYHIETTNDNAITGNTGAVSYTIDRGGKFTFTTGTSDNENKEVDTHIQVIVVKNAPIVHKGDVTVEVKTTTGTILTPAHQVADGIVNKDIPSDKTSVIVPSGYEISTASVNGKVVNVSTKTEKINGKTVTVVNVPNSDFINGTAKIVYNVKKITDNVTYTISTVTGKAISSGTVGKGNPNTSITSTGIEIPKGYKIVSISSDTGKVTNTPMKDGKITVTTNTPSSELTHETGHVKIVIEKIPTGIVNVSVVTQDGKTLVQPHETSHGEQGKDITNYGYTPVAGYHLVGILVNGKKTTEGELAKMHYSDRPVNVQYVVAKNTTPKIKSSMSITVVTNTGRQIGTVVTVNGTVGETFGNPLDHVNIPNGYKITQVTINGEITTLGDVSKDVFTNPGGTQVIITITPKVIPTKVTYTIGNDTMPSKSTMHTEGGNTVITIEPGVLKHYHPDTVTINGKTYNHIKVDGDKIIIPGKIKSSVTDTNIVNVHFKYNTAKPDVKPTPNKPDVKPTPNKPDVKPTPNKPSHNGGDVSVNSGEITVKTVTANGTVIRAEKTITGEVGHTVNGTGFIPVKGYHLVHATVNGKVVPNNVIPKIEIADKTTNIVWVIAKDTTPNKPEVPAKPNKPEVHYGDVTVKTVTTDGTVLTPLVTNKGEVGKQVSAGDVAYTPIKGYHVTGVTVNGQPVPMSKVPTLDFGNRTINVVWTVSKDTTPAKPEVPSKPEKPQVPVKPIITTGEVTVTTETSNGDIVVPKNTIDGTVGKTVNGTEFTPIKGYHLVGVTVNGNEVSKDSIASLTVGDKVKNIVWIVAKDKVPANPTTPKTPDVKPNTDGGKTPDVKPNTDGGKTPSTEPSTSNSGNKTPDTSNTGNSGNTTPNTKPVVEHGEVTVKTVTVNGTVMTPLVSHEGIVGKQVSIGDVAYTPIKGYHVVGATVNGNDIPLTKIPELDFGKTATNVVWIIAKDKTPSTKPVTPPVNPNNNNKPSDHGTPVVKRGSVDVEVITNTGVLLVPEHTVESNVAGTEVASGIGYSPIKGYHLVGTTVNGSNEGKVSVTKIKLKDGTTKIVYTVVKNEVPSKPNKPVKPEVPSNPAKPEVKKTGDVTVTVNLKDGNSVTNFVPTHEVAKGDVGTDVAQSITSYRVPNGYHLVGITVNGVKVTSVPKIDIVNGTTKIVYTIAKNVEPVKPAPEHKPSDVKPSNHTSSNSGKDKHSDVNPSNHTLSNGKDNHTDAKPSNHTDANNGKGVHTSVNSDKDNHTSVNSDKDNHPSVKPLMPRNSGKDNHISVNNSKDNHTDIKPLKPRNNDTNNGKGNHTVVNTTVPVSNKTTSDSNSTIVTEPTVTSSSNVIPVVTSGNVKHVTSLPDTGLPSQSTRTKGLGLLGLFGLLGLSVIFKRRK